MRDIQDEDRLADAQNRLFDLQSEVYLTCRFLERVAARSGAPTVQAEISEAIQRLQAAGQVGHKDSSARDSTFPLE